ncbi:MAG: hypothetical protein JST16_00560 [Bdellovibrionales bacterium]|nr:hypothetical protein [Bdellovibrionales bacterium]
MERTQNTHKYPVLQYQELLKEYEGRLTSIERGFSMDKEFLEFWVPDEDTNKSLFYLFESASLKNEAGLSVVLDAEHISSVDSEGLVAALRGLGAVRSDKTPSQVTITVVFGAPDASDDALDLNVPGLSDLRRCYREKLLLETRTLKHSVSGPLKPSANLKAILTKFEGGTVMMAIDPSTTLVREFRYTGLKNNALTKMLDFLCQINEGYLIQEISEHGVIRLENELRDPTLPAPVRGIVTPENAGPYFVALNHLVREMFRQGREELGIKITRNTMEKPISKEWLALQDSERLAKIKAAALQFLTETNEKATIEVLAIKQAIHVYVDFEGCSAEQEKRLLCKGFEKFLKRNVEQKLEIYLPTAMDKLARDKMAHSLVKADPEVFRETNQDKGAHK